MSVWELVTLLLEKYCCTKLLKPGLCRTGPRVGIRRDQRDQRVHLEKRSDQIHHFIYDLVFFFNLISLSA